MEQEIKIEKMFGRVVKSKQEFYAEGTFQSLYMARDWISDNGYSEGSLCRDMPVAIQKGEYCLPQKWKNFDKEAKSLIDGVMISNDFREGSVTVVLFQP